MMRKLFPMYAILFFLFASQLMPELAQATIVNASVDRDVVNLDESFQVQFSAAGSVDGDPDFSPLEQDFEVLSRQRSSNISIINGRSEYNYVWSLSLRAKHVGELIIPAIAFGQDTSSAVRITVNRAVAAVSAQGQPIFLEVETDKTQAYVQEQVLYTIRLYRAVELRSAELGEPRLADIEVNAVRLGEDRSFQKNVAGINYLVHERRYAVFPQTAGESHFLPIEFKGEVVQRSSSLFDPFGQNTVTKRVQSAERSLLVKVIPAGVSAKDWLPTPNLHLEQTWSLEPPVFKVGEPITRTIRITAAAVDVAQLPAINLGDIAGVKQYPDQASQDTQTSAAGLLSIREQKFAMIPNTAGQVLFPALEVTWWNTQTEQLETAKLAAQQFTVLPGSQSQQITPAPLNQLPTDTIKPTASMPELVPESQLSQDWWPWLSAVLGFGWLSTAWLWWLSVRRRRHAFDQQSPQQDKKLDHVAAAHRAVMQACKTQNHQSIKTALLHWAKLQWPEQPPHNLHALAQRLTQGCDSNLSVLIDALDQVLYSPHAAGWDSQQFATVFADFQPAQLGADSLANKMSLQALHPLSP